MRNIYFYKLECKDNEHGFILNINKYIVGFHYYNDTPHINQVSIGSSFYRDVLFKMICSNIFLNNKEYKMFRNLSNIEQNFIFKIIKLKYKNVDLMDLSY